MSDAVRTGVSPPADMRGVLDALPVPAWTCTPDGLCALLNRAWCAYTGLPEAAQRGLGWIEALHAEDRESVMAAWMVAVHDGTECVVEARVRRADGVYRWFASRTGPAFDTEGRVRAWFGVATDVDDRKCVENALRRMDTRKDEFLHMLAHELRNPLAPLRNVLHLLRSPGGGGLTGERALDMLERQVKQLTRLLDDLLDMSRIANGRIQLKKEPVSLDEVVRSVLADAEPLLETHQFRLSLLLPAETVRLNGDPARLGQMVSNLLHNAIKYTPDAGRIEISVARERDTVVLRVRDSGAGIPPELLPRIFELGTVADRPFDRAQGGLGIGLAIVRSIAEMHGGTVTAHSDGPGLGSEFVVRMPACSTAGGAPISFEPEPGRAALDGRGASVLVVEDNLDAAQSLAMLVELQGFAVRTVHSGPQAIEAALAAPPDVVLCDIGLPGLDGYEVARRLRSERTTAHALLVALTGYGQDEDRLRALEAGFDRHFIKPVDPEALERLLAERVRGV